MQTLDQYLNQPPQWKLGQVGDSRINVVIGTRKSLAAAPIGRFYVKDSSQAGVDNLVRLPSATGDITQALLEGVLILSDTLENDPTVAYPQFPLGVALGVLKKGPVVVQCETAFAPATDTLYVRVAANGAGTAAGQVCNAADGGNTVSLGTFPIKGLNTLAAAGLLQLDLSLV